MTYQQRVVFLVCAGHTSAGDHMAGDYFNQLLRIQAGAGSAQRGTISTQTTEEAAEINEITSKPQSSFSRLSNRCKSYFQLSATHALEISV